MKPGLSLAILTFGFLPTPMARAWARWPSDSLARGPGKAPCQEGKAASRASWCKRPTKEGEVKTSLAHRPRGDASFQRGDVVRGIPRFVHAGDKIRLAAGLLKRGGAGVGRIQLTKNGDHLEQGHRSFFFLKVSHSSSRGRIASMWPVISDSKSRSLFLLVNWEIRSSVALTCSITPSMPG